MSRFATRMAVVGGACLIGVLGCWWWEGSRADGRVGDRVTGADGVRVALVREAAETGDDEPFGDPGYPEIATERLIRVSLWLLAKNGADLRKPMPVRHRVLAANPGVAARVMSWARSSGYDPGAPVVYHEHGGVERLEVDLVRVVVPEPSEIETQGRQVFAAVGKIPGAMYQSWMGEIVR